MALSDLKGDGLLDLVISDYTGATLAIGNGDGSFQYRMLVDTGGSSHLAVAVGDLNDDGFKDIVTTKIEGSIKINFGHGDGTFDSAIQILAPGVHDLNSVVLANFDTTNPNDWLIA